jgi:hypothetical protein
MVPIRFPLARSTRLTILFVSLFALVLAACSHLVEPPQDMRLVIGLEHLAAGTEELAEERAEVSPAEREAAYAALDASAQHLVSLAEARAAAMAVTAEAAAYGIATAGFLTDFRRNLALLAARDAAAGTYGLLPGYVALRLAAMRDALGDALYYERVVLDRSH